MSRRSRKGQTHRARPCGLMSQAGVVHPVIVYRPGSSAGDGACLPVLNPGRRASGAVLGPDQPESGPGTVGGSAGA